MSHIYVSGLINTETTVRISGFPLDYYPIDYPFFGVRTQVSGVAYNLARALQTLGDRVRLASFLGRDLTGELVREQLRADGLDLTHVLRTLDQTPASAVLYDAGGRRQIHCDLKDIQDRRYPVDPAALEDCDMVVACNINFNRELLHRAKALGKTVATDVHVLREAEDDYNREFMECADILFLSDEALPCTPRAFLTRLAGLYPAKLMVLGRGSRGAMLYRREGECIHELPCVPARQVVNTVGAGDALFAGFLHFFSQGMDPVEALWHAQVFASAKIEADGAAQGFITEEEVRHRRLELP